MERLSDLLVNGGTRNQTQVGWLQEPMRLSSHHIMQPFK